MRQQEVYREHPYMRQYAVSSRLSRDSAEVVEDDVKLSARKGCGEAVQASRPVELHHQPLSELSVTLSRHSAPIRQTCRSFQCANVQGDARSAGTTFVRIGWHASCVL